jgi:hypothetical protein
MTFEENSSFQSPAKENVESENPIAQYVEVAKQEDLLTSSNSFQTNSSSTADITKLPKEDPQENASQESFFLLPKSTSFVNREERPVQSVPLIDFDSADTKPTTITTTNVAMETPAISENVTASSMPISFC